MKLLKGWFKERVVSRDRRRGTRLPAPRLVAYYWDGGAPTSHEIRDISSSGFYLLTDARWFPGTMVTMTLQKTAPSADGSEQYVAVQSRVIRLGTDGVGLAFSLPHGSSSNLAATAELNVVDRKTLDKFIKWIERNNGEVSMNCALLPLLFLLIAAATSLGGEWGAALVILAAKSCKVSRHIPFYCKYMQSRSVYYRPQFSSPGITMASLVAPVSSARVHQEER